VPLDWFAHGMSEAEKIRAAEGGITEFLRQGAVHIITRYDHLLFLFGVIFFLKNINVFGPPRGSISRRNRIKSPYYSLMGSPL